MKSKVCEKYVRTPRIRRTLLPPTTRTLTPRSIVPDNNLPCAPREPPAEPNAHIMRLGNPLKPCKHARITEFRELAQKRHRWRARQFAFQLDAASPASYLRWAQKTKAGGATKSGSSGAAASNAGRPTGRPSIMR